MRRQSLATYMYFFYMHYSIEGNHCTTLPRLW